VIKIEMEEKMTEFDQVKVFFQVVLPNHLHFPSVYVTYRNIRKKKTKTKKIQNYLFI